MYNTHSVHRTTFLSGLALAALTFCSVSSRAVQAATIVQNVAPVADSNFNNVPGQSVTTTALGPGFAFGGIAFNFFNGGVSTANGTLFILTQAYTGTPATLSSGTTGYLAQTVGNGTVYQFAPSLLLQPNTQYFFYSNAQFANDAQSAGAYAGGNYYSASSTTFPFGNVPTADATFRLTGTAVSPEPSSWALLAFTGMGALGLMLKARRRVSAPPATV